MMLLWGVYPIQCAKLKTTEEMVQTSERMLLEAGAVRQKEIMGLVAGTRTRSGSTNFMRLHVVGDTEIQPGTKSHPDLPAPVEATQETAPVKTKTSTRDIGPSSKTAKSPRA
jgi:pyruvate kinase